VQESVSGVLIWFSDVEKQSAVLEVCQQQTGHCYAALGISPDNIDRTNKKMHGSWLLKIEELALAAECVAIVSGLNLTKEMGTHFAQESLLKSCAEIAERLNLPLILHVASDGASLSRALEILTEAGWICDTVIPASPATNRTLILYDALSACSGDLHKVQNVVDAGVYCMISAAGLTDPSEKVKSSFEACLRCVPLPQLVACTDSPWKTPQNLADVYLRTLRNEPCNMSAVVDAIASGLGTPRDSLAQTIHGNTLRVFGIPLSTLSQQTFPALPSPTRGERSLSTEKHTEEVPDSSKPSASMSKSRRYHCAKCRRLIAASSDAVTHTVGASRSVFSIGEEGLCSASLFLPYASSAQAPRAQVSQGYLIEQEVVHCAECRAKIGKVSLSDATCSCGTIVSGPVLRINTTKLDQFFEDADSLDTSQLSAILSRLEDQEPRDDEANQSSRSKAKKKKKGKHKMAANKGNYSSFRNKSFIPNASRKKKEMVPGTGTGEQEDADGDSGEEEDEEGERAPEGAGGFMLKDAHEWGGQLTALEEDLESEEEEEEEEVH
jgi:Tat protein secretion system quality control protein TatD with DNase activity